MERFEDEQPSRRFLIYLGIVLLLMIPLLLSQLLANTSSIAVKEQSTIAPLPDEVQPLVEPKIRWLEKIPRYEVNLTFFPDRNQLRGNSRIIAWNRHESPTNELYIHLFLNAFNKDKEPPVLHEFLKKVYIRGTQFGGITMQSVQVNGMDMEFEINGELLRIPLSTSWAAQESIEVSLEWEADIPDIHHRVGQEKGAYWFGNSLPILAVYDNQWRTNVYEKVGDPFYSEISDYQVNIRTPLEYRVYATGEETEESFDTVKDTYVTAKQVRDFAFVISPDHKMKSASTSQGKKINIYYRKANEKLVESHLQQSVQMLEYMEKRVGEYPYSELDIFENDLFISGMEYPGIVFVDSSRLNRESGVQTILHEIAHQWFYNIIGNNQITEPWLDEGMATYFTDEFIYGNQLTAFYESEIDRLNERSFDVVIREVQSYQNWSSYWWGDYRKSSIMIYLLRYMLGEKVFDQWIKDYMEAFQYRIVNTEEFIRFTEQYTQEDLAAFFEEWFD